MQRVLFVCLGNICRSPTAQGVFESLVQEAGLHDRISADSAGTHGYHTGNPPDSRASAAARLRGIDLSAQRARVVTVEDFSRFDFVLAMDRSNHAHLERLAPPEHAEKVLLATDFATDLGYDEVPDPYYGGDKGFEQVLDLLDTVCRNLLDHIASR